MQLCGKVYFAWHILNQFSDGKTPTKVVKKVVKKKVEKKPEPEVKEVEPGEWES